jgi:Protein of unknown function (DUF2637)
MNDNPRANGSRGRDPYAALRLIALIAAIAGVVVLAAAAFVLSYGGIHKIALSAGVSPSVARVFPVIFDAMLVVSCAAVVSLRSAGWWQRTYAWLTTLALLVVVAAADAVQATGTHIPRKPAAATVAILPWALLLLSFSLLLSMLRQFRRTQAAAADAASAYSRSGLDILDPRGPSQPPALAGTTTEPNAVHPARTVAASVPARESASPLTPPPLTPPATIPLAETPSATSLAETPSAIPPAETPPAETPSAGTAPAARTPAGSTPADPSPASPTAADIRAVPLAPPANTPEAPASPDSVSTTGTTSQDSETPRTDADQSLNGSAPGRSADHEPAAQERADQEPVGEEHAVQEQVALEEADEEEAPGDGQAEASPEAGAQPAQAQLTEAQPPEAQQTEDQTTEAETTEAQPPVAQPPGAESHTGPSGSGPSGTDEQPHNQAPRTETSGAEPAGTQPAGGTIHVPHQAMPAPVPAPSPHFDRLRSAPTPPEDDPDQDS